MLLPSSAYSLKYGRITISNVGKYVQGTTLNMEASRFSEMSVIIYQTTWRHSPEDRKIRKILRRTAFDIT
jgi:hypothetical protein